MRETRKKGTTVCSRLYLVCVDTSELSQSGMEHQRNNDEKQDFYTISGIIINLRSATKLIPKSQKGSFVFEHDDCVYHIHYFKPTDLAA